MVVASIWDANTGEILNQVKLNSRNLVYSVAFSPDNQKIVIGCE